MELVGIICELNPLHNGHKLLFEKAREISGADGVICAMSPNFVQRGEVACLDKHTRAKHAILVGADIVIQIPTLYATSSANRFAYGGVRTLKTCNAFSHLAFGSECGSLDILNSANTILSSEENEFKTVLKENLAKGVSFPKAKNNAFDAVTSGEFDKIISSPNNVLALEYLKNIDGKTIKPITIKRQGADYHDLGFNEAFCSSSALRFATHEGTLDAFIGKAPSFTLDSLSARVCDFNSRLFSILKFSLSSAQTLKTVPDVVEGLENRILSAIKNARNYDELLTLISTKRYTLSRLKRILINALLGISIADFNKYEPTYVEVLAIRRSKLHLLSHFNTTTITKPFEGKNLSSREREIDLCADRLFASISQHPLEKSMQIID